MSKKSYDDFISAGYISLTPPATDFFYITQAYIIPHHGVIREDKLTSNLRVVLDRSAEVVHLLMYYFSATNPTGFNDILYNV